MHGQRDRGPQHLHRHDPAAVRVQSLDHPVDGGLDRLYDPHAERVTSGAGTQIFHRFGPAAANAGPANAQLYQQQQLEKHVGIEPGDWPAPARQGHRLHQHNQQLSWDGARLTQIVWHIKKRVIIIFWDL